MMTEQRAIDLLKGILPKKVSFAQMICASNCYGDEMVYQEPEPYAIEFAINSIQENTKLKAEIKRLNGKSEMYRDMADSFCNSNIKLEAEIEQLKSELEQSVRLQKTDEESEKERIIIWLNDFCDKFAKCNQCIFNGRCKEFDEMDFDEIKSQYEEAEQSLKGTNND